MKTKFNNVFAFFDKRLQKLKISVLVRFIAIEILIIILVTFFNLIFVWKNYRKLDDLQGSYERSVDQLDALRQGSDVLTDEARNYIVTGKYMYIENYFREAEVTKRREKAVEALELYASDAACEYLQKGLEESNTLMNTEYKAFVIASECYGVVEERWPETLLEWKNEHKDELANCNKSIEYATELVFGVLYQNDKSTIAGYIESCNNIIKEEIGSNTAAISKRLNYAIMLQMVIMVILAISILMFFITIDIAIVMPIKLFSASVSDDTTVDPHGTIELVDLANEYNKLYMQNLKNKGRLEYKAEHDALTKLYNRQAFDKMCDAFSRSRDPIGIIMLDVDKFKEINDNYGHAVGDNALQSVAYQMKRFFRAQDYIFRYGGDEFVAILTGVNEESYKAIEAKLKKLSVALQRPVNSVSPPLSYSAGVVFCQSGFKDQDLKMADDALYNTKLNGRNGYTIYQGGEKVFYSCKIDEEAIVN
ncbi:MAG: GGDEF domain-containing protein [Butyrivibrio sp.]|nr:GGDEF domain-containing protein [Butyrivibrio sp.]